MLVSEKMEMTSVAPTLPEAWESCSRFRLMEAPGSFRNPCICMPCFKYPQDTVDQLRGECVVHGSQTFEPKTITLWQDPEIHNVILGLVPSACRTFQKIVAPRSERMAEQFTYHLV